MIATSPSAKPAATTFESLNPASGAVVGTFPIDGPDEVAAAVGRAREAARWWSALDFAERRRRLAGFRRVVAQRIDELSELVHRENGKPDADAFLETMLALHHVAWAARNARRVLSPRRVRPGMLAANHAAQVVYDAAKKQGFVPDFTICADEVPTGRPEPWMIFRAMEALGVYPPSSTPRRWASGWPSASPRRSPSSPWCRW